jgi:uncharacterized protein YecE (DUF72 family)
VSPVRIGTTGWTDKTLLESGYYPESVRTPADRLRYYAAQFPIVEVDSSYYAIPTPDAAHHWAERTPEAFVFDLKAFRLFTGHQTPPAALPPGIRLALRLRSNNVYYKDIPADLRTMLWDTFRAALAPLQAAGKLGAVVFQFSPWFLRGPDAYDHILQCREHLPGFRIAIEMRNRSWYGRAARAELLAFEREHGLTHVAVDAPQGRPTSPRSIWEVTSPDLAIVRLHGRNAAAWDAKGLKTAAERFNYFYSDAELQELAEPVQALAAKARDIHVLFNNCYRDNAQRNAARFRAILKGESRA